MNAQAQVQVKKSFSLLEEGDKVRVVHIGCKWFGRVGVVVTRVPNMRQRHRPPTSVQYRVAFDQPTTGEYQWFDGWELEHVP